MFVPEIFNKLTSDRNLTRSKKKKKQEMSEEVKFVSDGENIQ